MDITDVATQSAQTTVMANIQMQEIVLRLHAHKPSHLNDYTNSMVGAHPWWYLWSHHLDISATANQDEVS